jgi:hypothetical protein
MLCTNRPDHSKALLLSAVGPPSPSELVVVLRPSPQEGNHGVELTYAGARGLLRDHVVLETSVGAALKGGIGGKVGVVLGSAWSDRYPEVMERLGDLEALFERLIVFPSSYVATDPGVRTALAMSRALFFARELVSYEAIRDLARHSACCLDTAFFFDYSPYRMQGRPGSVLHAFRTDLEARGIPVPPINHDVSALATSLDHWLWTIAAHEIVKTDRAHVMMAAAAMGKKVIWRPSNTPKVGALAAFLPKDYDVSQERIVMEPAAKQIAPIG